MAALDATVGGPSANSYVTEAEATDYFDSHVLAIDMSAYIAAQSVLIHASRLLDDLVVWIGTKSTTTQAMEWPRDVPSGEYVNEIPQNVKHAVFELSLHLVTTGSTVSDDDINQIDVGPVKLKFNVDAPSVMLPQLVTAIIASLGAVRVFSGDGVSLMPLERV